MNHLLEIQSHAEQKLLKLIDPIDDGDRDQLSAGLEILSNIFDITEGLSDKDNCID